MGGKPKQSQRTKNNVKPSSSGRSAEIINSAKIDTNLVCVGGGKILPALFPTLAASASMENDIDPEFQMCIKKLNKKDPITKTKALQELTELVNNSKVDDVVAMLPSWAHYYKMLSFDLDRKVREYTQACHGAVVGACGRRAAPWLRRVVPAWLLALHDAHAPAQAHAARALAKTFPDNKLPDVISFCKTEILTHIVDNLMSNPDSVLSKKIENAEDKEAQYNCIVSSSLRGLTLLTQRLAPAHHDWLWEQLDQLLFHHNSFWKLASHNYHQIRAAWYETISHIIERFKGVFGDKYGQKTLRILMGAGKDSNASVAAGLWNCLVMIMHNVEGWHTYLDKKQLIVKRIIDVLENGGWGDTKHLTSILLPLLASLPEHLLTKEFYESFFNAMFTGLEKKSILSSKSERQLWIANLAECLRYLSIRQNDFVVEVTTSVHRSWLEMALSTEHAGQLRNNLIKFSATSMASLVKYWLKQSKEPNGEKYDQLVRNFWQNIASKLSTQIDKLSSEEEDIARHIDGHVLLLQTLKISFLHEPKKAQSIKFEDSEVMVQRETASPEKCDPTIVERFKHNLENVVQNVCYQYLQFAGEKKLVNAVLTPLLSLLIEFNQREVLLAVARQFDVDSLSKFYEKVFREWLFDEALRCKVVVDVVFLMLQHMTEEEQEATLDSFNQFPVSVAEWCLAVSLSHPHRARRCVRRWVRGEAATRALLRACAALVTHDGASTGASTGGARNLLLMCFSHDDREELIISADAVTRIVQLVSTALREQSSACLEQLSRLGAQLASALLIRADTHHAAPDLLIELIGVTLRVPRGDSRLSVDTWCELRSSAQDGVAALPPQQRARLLRRVAALHDQHVRSRNNKNPKICIDKIEQICSLSPYILTANSRLPEDLAEIVMFTKALLEVEAPSIEYYAVRYDCVHSKLNCPFDDDNDIIKRVAQDSDDAELSKSDLVAFMNSLLLRAMYLRTLFLHKPDDEEDEPTWCERLLSEQYFQTEFCKVLYDYMIVCTLHEGYGFWPHHKILRDGKAKLDMLLDDIINETSTTLRNTIQCQLSHSAAATGYYWSYARRHYELRARVEPAALGARALPHGAGDLQLAQLRDIVTGNGFFHTLQANLQGSTDAQSDARAQYLVMVRALAASASRAGELDRVFTCELLANCATCHLDMLVNAYYRHNHLMLFDTDISQAPWHAAVCNAAALEYLTTLVTREGWDLPAHHWDFINIACCSVATSLEKSKDAWGTTKVSMVARSLLRLYVAVHTFVASVPAQCEKQEPAAHVAALPEEWRDIFEPSVHDSLFHLMLHVLQSDSAAPTCPRVAVLHALAQGSAHLDWSCLPKPSQLDVFALSRVCARAAECLARPVHVAYKYLAYHLLAMLVDPLILEDMGKLSMWSEQTSGVGQEEYDRPKLALEYFDEQLDYLLDIVNEVVANVQLGEGVCEVTPFSDSHSSCVGWLLLLRLSHKLFARARSTVALHYLEIYRIKNFAEPVLNAALRLLPEEVFTYTEDNVGTTPVPTQYTDMFFHNTPLDMYAPVSSSVVSQLACGAVCAGVSCAAGGARAWCAAASAPRARALRRLARAFLAPTLVRDHFARVMRAAPTFTNAVITTYWSTYEVVCVYTVEDHPIELHIALAKDYPIGVANVYTPSLPTPGADTNWVALYLAHQNGSVVEAVRMWMAGVETRVENSPVCYICYARLHPSSGKLPRLACHQCHNKFHASCLSKWFTTSSKSSCPLCRAQF
ncbi:E3 ubiquitin-protein ligase listerin [Manduca sexta]|uniref:E3 ubiquitin-protein ligase listerin n=1 Tax=Manduca sexta TaxID=7130 RepID=UPI0011839B81|nr:E3 ubiquitin-protein ligase listerin [Manduca sexta]